MAKKKPVTVTVEGLRRAKIDTALIDALSESIERLADKALPEPWNDILKDYGILCRADESDARIYAADFAEFTKRYTEALYDQAEAEAAQEAAAGAARARGHSALSEVSGRILHTVKEDPAVDLNNAESVLRAVERKIAEGGTV